MFRQQIENISADSKSDAESFQNQALFQTNLQYQNKINTNNRGRTHLQPINLGGKRRSQSRSNENVVKIGGGLKGIKLVTSRQSSTQRAGITSRDTSRQKNSQQIRSQTNISEFQESPSDKKNIYQAKNENLLSQVRQFSQIFEQKLKEEISKINIAHQLEIYQLSQIVNENETKISNLIETLNVMAEADDLNRRKITKLQKRIENISRYQEQCYSYSMKRVEDFDVILKILMEEIQQKKNNCIILENKLQFINLASKNIFDMQNNYIEKYRILIQSDVNSFENRLINLSSKYEELHSKTAHLQFLQDNKLKMMRYNQQIMKQIKAQQAIESSTQDQIDKNSLKIEQIEAKYAYILYKQQELEKQKQELIVAIQKNEQKARLTIWELSNLMNKLERENERIKQQNDRLISYTHEIENKLIEVRFKENHLKSELENEQKDKDINSQYASGYINQLVSERTMIQQKYENITRHNNYLQEINSKNNLLILKLNQQIQEFKIKCIESERNKQNIVQNNSQQKQLRTLLNMRQEQIKQKHREITLLSDLNARINGEYNKLHNQFMEVKIQWEQEQIYTNQLEDENQKLKKSLDQYSKIFEHQSQMFKLTIEKLKKQNSHLKVALDTQGIKSKHFSKLLIEGQSQSNIASSENQLLSNDKRINPLPLTKVSSNQVYLRLKDALQNCCYSLPAPCQIDGAGYLKHAQSGIYIIDQDQNLFELNHKQTEAAVKMGLINIYQ